MGKIYDVAGDWKFPYNVREFLNLNNWRREFRYDRQRKQRGWSDRDTWGGGEYILEVTSGVLKKLGDDKSHIDWDEYFITNYPNNRGYNSLGEVAADIDNYLKFDEYAWGSPENLGFEIKYGSKELPNGNREMIDLNTPRENALIKKAIRKSHEEQKRLYVKAKNAMIFVAINFPALWD